ncbi:MAG: P-II family nitrogen regulator [Clostridiaceae bacterium]
MFNVTHNLNAELITVIVNQGWGSRILKSAKKSGAKGGTIILGKGTVRSKFFDFIGLNELHKEVLYMIAEKNEAYRILAELNQEFEFAKRGHGIAYSTSVCQIVGSKNVVCANLDEEGEREQLNYQVITIIVDKGRAELAIEAAEAAGSKGGTILNARGAGIHEVSRVFAMDVEPEKEVVLILSEASSTDAIIESISRKLNIGERGNGIIFVQNANKTYGIFQ